jgi:FAD/FMN-containing dehydrogenase
VRRIDQGFVYGDFQFDIDPHSRDFLTKGVFSCYTPIDEDTQPPTGQQQLCREDWIDLLLLAHTDKHKAFTRYAQHYLATDGQLYHSDAHQLSEYVDCYHEEIDRRMAVSCPGSEMITELYVPPEKLVHFLRRAAKLLSARNAHVIYGTIRLIEADDETFLPWAKTRSACVIFNLHVDHTASGIAHAADSFRALIDIAAAMGGSFYLTYHRFATAEQVLRCYPRFREFLEAKRELDPQGVFQSDWLRHHVQLLDAGA